MKKLFLTGSLILLSLALQAQYTREDAPPPQASQPVPNTAPQSKFWNNVSVGGGFGLQFGTVTYVTLSPLFNYHILDDIEIGIGPMYQYLNIIYLNDNYTSTTYGGRISASIFLPGRLSNLYIHGEYDVLNVPDVYSFISNVTRATIGFPLAGLGLKRPLSDKSFYYLLFSYNFNNTLLAPYFSNPVIEAGLDIGI
ncbi:MAG TPA: hypothetical protein VK890_05770, partial [Bacteroidia bacterium]|jgi:hypothetical protein|nr:hypothetical protein [Bacteroidia bacterium]